MIQVQKLHIEEFRGIRDLDLTMDENSFVVVGPNGSGKSGVVDAIDFALTGNVARLSGAGTAGLSVSKHAPHVHQRDNPAAAIVTLTFVHLASGQTGTLTRSVKTPAKFVLEPSTPELVSAVEWAAQHPELILARREVIKYVNTEPGKRAQEVQALLKLDRIDEIRRLLNAARNKTSSAAKSADDAVKSAEDGVKRALDTTSLLPSEVIIAVNKRREMLDIEALTTATLETDLSAGAAADDGQNTFNRASAIRDVEAVSQYLTEHEGLDKASSELHEALTELEREPAVLDALRHRHLVETGLPLVIDQTCPLCDLEWPDVASLRQHLNDKLTRSETAAALQQRVQTAAGKVMGQLRGVRSLIQTAQPHAVTMGQSALQTSLLDWSNDIAAFGAKLGSVDSIRSESERVASNILAVPKELAEGLSGLRTKIEALPDQSAITAARTFLTVAQERWTQLRQARANAIKADAAQKTATAVYEKYNSAADVALTSLYKTVEEDFSRFYRQINSDDESSFKAGLSPTAGKLGLEVDFYGLGMFSPMAYHSEGHQDGMGVCLYLALIRQLLKADFRLAVLDDVVTSVDANHRRQFCKLLKEAFPDVQFILTTHDEVWARQMQSSGLIARRSIARFQGWTVDGGPSYRQDGDFWNQIETDLANDEVPSAAHKLRRSLESSLSDIAASIQGQVVFRADNNYDLSSFFSAVKGRHGDLLKKASASANSWNNETAKQKVEELKAERTSAICAQDGENWTINALVHNNDWAAMTKTEFRPVVDACKQFLGVFTCSNDDCDGWIYVLGVPGNEEQLRCPCGSFELNLRKK